VTRDLLVGSGKYGAINAKSVKALKESNTFFLRNYENAIFFGASIRVGSISGLQSRQ
jgi:hypothetical protein